jgi:DNA-binding transcriptional regulator YdaS (Cro superfamily)
MLFKVNKKSLLFHRSFAISHLLMAKRNGKKPGPVIRAYLSKHGLTQSAFGRKLSVSQALVGQWIIGRARPTPAMTPLIERVTKGEITRVQLFPELYGKVTKGARKAARLSR